MEDEKLLYFLSKKFVLNPSAKVIKNVQLFPNNANIMIDTMVENNKDKIYVEIKRRISLESVYRLNAYKQLLNQQGMTDTKFTLLTVYVGDNISDIAKKLGVIIIQVPPSSLSEAVYENPKHSPNKLTSKKAFDVVYKMLSKGPSTIRDLSLASGVSYGWAHGIVTRLMEIGIVERRFGLYNIVNLDRLLDSIAYERPIVSVKSRKYRIDSNDILKFTKNVSSISRAMSIKASFMGPTASLLYDPYFVRSDTIYMYVEPTRITDLVDELQLGVNGCLKVLAYFPDRDVFTDSKVVNGVTVTTQEQVLLDLASFGILYREAFKRMVKEIGVE
jgi:hypothetical protein